MLTPEKAYGMQCIANERVEEVVELCKLDGECWDRIGLVRVEGME